MAAHFQSPETAPSHHDVAFEGDVLDRDVVDKPLRHVVHPHFCLPNVEGFSLDVEEGDPLVVAAVINRVDHCLHRRPIGGVGDFGEGEPQ
jgi:hypothetical protein